MARNKKERIPEYVSAHVDRLDQEGRGVARVDGKVVFIQGALPGEDVIYERIRSKSSYDVGRVSEVLKESVIRTTPKCPNFGIGPGSCGGCAMQHIEPLAQVAYKEKVLLDTLWGIGKVRPESILPPIYGPTWHYRHRARLTVRDVAKKGGILVGFHEKGSSYVADMTECPILTQKVSDLLVPLRCLISDLTIRQRLPQVEVAVGGDGRTAFVFRTLEQPTPEDLEKMLQFGRDHEVDIWLQPKGPESAHAVLPENEHALGLRLSEFDVRIGFKPTDFTQVNHALNETMVSRAIRLLDLNEHSKVADFFCGLGNFTLPIARCASKVIGIEGSEGLVKRALAGAQQNGLADKTTFRARNLFTWSMDDWVELMKTMGGLDRVLIDPPREGALELCRVLAVAPDELRVPRVVYVSCNPATLARDCAILHHEGGWHIRAAGIMNMFPHTGHVESMAVLEPGPRPEKVQAPEESLVAPSE